MTSTNENNQVKEGVEEEDGFKSSANQPLLTYNYLVLLSMQKQQCTVHDNVVDGVNIAWAALDSTCGKPVESTEAHIYTENTLQQALQKVFLQYIINELTCSSLTIMHIPSL